MKLITGIATVALIAGSVEISNAGCGKCAADPKESHHEHSEAVDANHQHSNQLTECAIEMFSELGTDRVSLIAKANGGCNKSATALVEDEIKAVTAMIGAMENEESRRILRLGMILQEWKSNPESTVNGDLLSGKELVDGPGSNESFDRTLNGIKKQLEAQLAQYRESTADSRVEN